MLDGHAIDAGLRELLFDVGDHFLEGFTHFFRRFKIERHATDIGFMRDIRGLYFHHDRITQTGGGTGRGIGIGGKMGQGDINSVGIKEFLGVVFTQSQFALADGVAYEQLKVVLGRAHIQRHIFRRFVEIFQVLRIMVHIHVGFNCFFRKLISRHFIIVEYLTGFFDFLAAHHGGQNRFGALLGSFGDRFCQIY